MSKIQFELNSDGVQELLKGSAMQGILQQYANQKAGQAGTGYAASVRVGQRRAYANIYPATDKARRDNLENNTLEKVIRS